MSGAVNVGVDGPATPEPTRPSSPRAAILRPIATPWVAVALAAGAFIALTGVGCWLRAANPDAGLLRVANEHHTGDWGAFADAVYVALDPIPAVALALVLAGAVWAVSRSLRVGLAFGGLIAAMWIPVEIVKVIVDRPRPAIDLLAHPFSPAQVDGSYPSGHTAFAAALVIALWLLMRDTRWRWLVLAGGLILVGVIGEAVVADGLHYPTDVLASIVWAIAMAPLARLLVVNWVLPWLWRDARRRVEPARP